MSQVFIIRLPTLQTRPLMLITEGYILLGGVFFLNDHHATMQQVLKAIVGEVTPRGASYVHLVLESLLRRYPALGSSILSQSGVIATMLKSCTANYHQVQGSEPDRVIVMYLSVFARVLLNNPHALDENLLPLSASFRHEQLVSLQFRLSFFPQFFLSSDLVVATMVLKLNLYFRFFPDASSDEYEPSRKRLWVFFLLSILSPSGQSSNFRNSVQDNMDTIFRCCLEVLEERKYPIVPYSIGYDSEEETLDPSLNEKRESLLHSDMVQVSSIT